MAATLLNGSAHLLQLLMGGGIINTRLEEAGELEYDPTYMPIYGHPWMYTLKVAKNYCGKQSQKSVN